MVTVLEQWSGGSIKYHCYDWARKEYRKQPHHALLFYLISDSGDRYGWMCDKCALDNGLVW